MRIAYQSFILENGLKVIVHEDPSVNKVAVNIVYKVGARDEQEHRTGLAHLFEHLMFSGSKNIPDYDTHVQRIGGECNAFTNSDLTNYYLTCPANQLETAFWLESDRMLEIDLSQKNVDVQKSVVCEEFKQRYLNQPYGDAYLHLRPLHYKKHPYRWMTIGMNLSHIEEVTLAECQHFFNSFYAPNNAVMCVAGGITLDQVKILAEKWFAPIPNRFVDRPIKETEPKQTEVRATTIHKKVPFSAVYKAYHMPARAEKAYYAADMITDILSNGKSTRLFQALVKEQKVASRISAFSWGLFDPGMISIEGRIAEGVSVTQYEEALAGVLNRLADEITETELQSMKNKVLSAETFEKTTILNRAMNLAIYDYIGDAELINTNSDRYQQLTLDDIRQAIAEYLRPTNCSTLYYLSETAHPSNA